MCEAQVFSDEPLAHTLELLTVVLESVIVPCVENDVRGLHGADKRRHRLQLVRLRPVEVAGCLTPDQIHNTWT